MCTFAAVPSREPEILCHGAARCQGSVSETKEPRKCLGCWQELRST